MPSASPASGSTRAAGSAAAADPVAAVGVATPERIFQIGELLRHAGVYRGTRGARQAAVTTDGAGLYLQLPATSALPLVRAGGGDFCARGLPIDIEPQILFYRRDLFEQHGIAVPRTWAEFEQAAALTRNQRERELLLARATALPG